MASAPLQIIAGIVRSEAEALKILDALRKSGWVCAPIVPTDKMLDAAYWSAHGENAAGVWEDMIEAVGEG